MCLGVLPSDKHSTIIQEKKNMIRMDFASEQCQIHESKRNLVYLEKTRLLEELAYPNF